MKIAKYLSIFILLIILFACSEPDDSEIITFNKTFGGSSFEHGCSVQETRGGGFIITGSTHSYGAEDSDVWLIKTDKNGTKKWDRTFGGNLSDYGHSVQETKDGGFIITGHTFLYGAGGYDVWLIKTDVNGNKKWDKTFGGSDSDYFLWIH